MATVLTYGTYDIIHYGHVLFLKRAKELAEGGKLIVGLSTDCFHEKLKHKPKCYFTYEQRKKVLEGIEYVDEVFPEETWEQKAGDIEKYNVDILVMGDDWSGKFNCFQTGKCKVMTLPRTIEGFEPISDTQLKQKIFMQKQADLDKIDIVVTYVKEDAPGFIEEREMWRAKTTSLTGCGQNSKCRWRDWNFLNFWFRGVEQNVPWVNKVFLVVKDKLHIPTWLNLDHPKLRIIFHDEYIPKQFLPTFNTHTIEMFYANIPDLSEYYITCNDDFFFTNPTPKDYFVLNGIPVRDLRHKETLIRKGDWSAMLKNGQVLLSKMYFDGNSLPYTFGYTHLPELRCKSLEKNLLEKWKDELYATLGDGKFRNRKNCVSSWLFVDALKYDKRYPKI